MRPQHTTGQAATLTKRQQKQLFKSLVHGTRDHLIMMFSFKLGLRAKELASLNISDVVDSHGKVRDQLRLTTDKTKGERHRDIPLTNQAVRKAVVAYVQDLNREEGPLFRTQKRNRFTQNSLQQRMSLLFQRAGLDGKYSSHTGRRTFITSLAQQGFDLNSIRELAGHTSLTTTQRYIDNCPVRLGEMMKAV